MHILEFSDLELRGLSDSPVRGTMHPGDSGGSRDYRRATEPPQEAMDVPAPIERAFGAKGIESFLKGLGSHVALALPHDVLVTLEIQGDDGGTWTLHTDHGRLDVQSGRAIWADSVLRCTRRRFAELVTGAVDVRQAFLDGTVQVEGDVGLLLRLYEALPEAV